MTRARITRVGQSEANSEAFIRFVGETYKDDFNGYRADILGMRSDVEWQNRVGSKLLVARRVAVQSGHGIGKTGFCAAAIHWFLATRPKPAVVATANTEVQLQTKLWRELAKVNQQAVNKDWFDWQATKFSLAASPTAFAQAITWNENNPEAFAGTHEEHVLGVFDEASGIPDPIWTTFSGAMTTAGAKWLAVGNPTTNTGRFYEMCNGSMRWEQEGDELDGKWHAYTVGSAESPLVTDEWIREQRATLREDEFRVRVLGLPPLEAPDQFISPTLVDEAARRKNALFERWPLVLGVDVARQGNDKSVIMPRRGKIVLDRIRSFHNLSLKQLAWKVAEEIKRYRDEGLEVSAVFIEGGGSIGWGVIEELWELGYEQVREVNPGASSLEPERFPNMRNQMWGYMKEWLEEGGQLPLNGDLRSDLIIPKRKPDPSMKLRLESKDEMRRRSGRSPDFGDALALTFAAPVELLPEKRRDKGGDYETIDDYSGDWMTL
jgi:hypothetical protein